MLCLDGVGFYSLFRAWDFGGSGPCAAGMCAGGQADEHVWKELFDAAGCKKDIM